jgi:hypothetical protein
MDRRALRAHARAHVNPKLRRNLRLYLLISAVLLIAVIYETAHYHAVIWQVGLALLIGALCGGLFARMYKISWDKDAQHVSSNIDIYGVVVLVLYVAYDLSRGHLVHIFIHNQGVPAISLALLAGAMYGRVLASGRVIMRILKEQEVFSL